MTVVSKVIKGINGEKPPLLLFPSLPLDSTYLKLSEGDLQYQGDVHLLDYVDASESLPEKYNLKQLIKDLKLYLENNKIGRFNIFAHGLGGLIALKLVTDVKDQIDEIVLFSTSASSKYRPELGWNIRDKYSMLIKNELDEYYGKLDENSLEHKFTRAYAAYFNPPDLTKAMNLISSSKRLEFDLYAALIPDLEQFDVRYKLKKFKGRCLIMTAEDDVWPLKYIREIQNYITDHSLYHFKTGGHFKMVEDPEEFWGAVGRWLNQS